MAPRILYSVIFIGFPNQNNFGYLIKLRFGKFFIFVESKIILSLSAKEIFTISKVTMMMPAYFE